MVAEAVDEAEAGDIVAEEEVDGEASLAAVEADAVPLLAESEQVPVGIPVDETSGQAETEEHPPAA